LLTRSADHSFASFWNSGFDGGCCKGRVPAEMAQSPTTEFAIPAGGPHVSFRQKGYAFREDMP